MESPNDRVQRSPLDKLLHEQNDPLTQLMRLAMLYHSRGRVEEAREIYKLIMQLRNNESTQEQPDSSSSE